MRITERSLRRLIRETLRRALFESDLDSPDVDFGSIIRNLKVANQHPENLTGKPDAEALERRRAARSVSDRKPSVANPESSVVEKSLHQFQAVVFRIIDNWDTGNMLASIPPQYKKYIMDLKNIVDKDLRVEKDETKKALKDAAWIESGADNVAEIYTNLISAQPKLADGIRKMSVMFALAPYAKQIHTSINYFKQLDPEKKIKDWDSILKEFENWYKSSNVDSLVKREYSDSPSYLSPEKAHSISWGWLKAMGVEAQDIFETMVDKIEDKDIAKRFASSQENRELSDALWSLASAKNRMKP
jgi:hypothetical protein